MLSLAASTLSYSTPHVTVEEHFTDIKPFEMISSMINGNKSSTWTATVPTRFDNLAAVKQLCGTFPLEEKDRLPEREALAAMDLPDTFDARTQWPKCSVISTVRDQSACGSCWAFGSTEAFEDRRCVATGEDVEFSSDDTAGCCSGFACGLSMGCNGGQPSAALNWMCKTGVVTGGDYTDIGKGGSCKPYEFAPCAHHVDPSPQYPACPSSEYSLKCSKSCSESGYSKSYADDKAKCSKAFSVRGEQQIMQALYQEGPLAVAFTVYSDFPTYKSGVYQHQSGSALGGHAVEMIGWGTENGTPYWLIKNSWNDQWGDKGTFKILRGSNECGIEGDVSGVSF